MSVPVNVSALRYLGLVCLDDIFDFAGLSPQEIEDQIKLRTQNIASVRVLIGKGKTLRTFIHVNEAIALTKEHGELCYLREELEVFHNWLRRHQPAQEDLTICMSMQALQVIVLACNQRAILVRKGDGELFMPSLSRLLGNERLQPGDFGGELSWVKCGDVEGWGIFDDNALEAFENAARVARHEAWVW